MDDEAFYAVLDGWDDYVAGEGLADVAGDGDSGLLSTGTGALLFLGLVYLLVEEGHRRLR